MVTNMQSRWAVAGTTFLLWALVAGSAVFWGLRMSARSAAAPMAAVTRPPPAADPVAVARLLGATSTASAAPAAPALASRLVLVGVVAGATSHQGVALIAVDGKPAKPFRVGATIDEGVVLQSVQGRRAALAQGTAGPVVLTLELPPRK